MATESPNISTNSAFTSSSSLASCCLRREIKAVTLSKFATILSCSIKSLIGISVSSSVFLLMALNVLPVPFAFSSSILEEIPYQRYFVVQTASSAEIDASPRPIQHSQSAIFIAPIGARTEINISPGCAIFVGALHHTRIFGCISPKSAFP